MKNKSSECIKQKNLHTEDWMFFHPNGKHMFNCDEKRANWYLNKNLGKKVGNRKLMLTFNPSGTGFEENETFGLLPRKQICVVNGTSDELQRHHIVPYCYRTHFSEKYKSRNHHDVVLINEKLHSEYEKSATIFKNDIARIYGVKTISEYNDDYTAGLLANTRSDGIALSALYSIFKSHVNNTTLADIKNKLEVVSANTNIPFEKLMTYNYIQLYYLYLEFKKMHENNTLNYKKENRIRFDHGYHVVQKLDTEEKMSDFIKLWRRHFIDTMQPQHMPSGWSIDFRIKTNL